ncbi:MAG: hypothetical protein PVJ55_08365 [Anaerolineae bacterium]
MTETDHKAKAEWEAALIADYYDYRWRKIMEPLCDKMQRWKDGNLSHGEIEQTLEVAHDEICEARSLFRQRRDRLVNLIRHWDREWFERWVEDHAPSRTAPSRD